MEPDEVAMVRHSGRVAAAFVSKNTVSAGDLPGLVTDVYAALSRLGAAPAAPPVASVPAVPIRKSVSPTEVVCLECGKGLFTLKRHLSAAHGLTIEQYRQKWSLPFDHPLIAPSYSALRANIRLGRRKKARVKADATP